MRSKAEVLQAIADLDEDAEALVEGPNLEREFRQRREDLLKELAYAEANEKYVAKPRCANCIYCVKHEENQYLGGGHSYNRTQYRCHRRLHPYGTHGHGVFLPVNYDDWCGEWLGENPERILIGADKLEESGFLEAAGLLRMWYHKKPGG